MGKTIKLAVLGVLILGATGLALAASDSKTYTVSAAVPVASGVNIAAVSITTATPPVATAVTGLALNFGNLSFDAVNGILVPSNYFAISAAPAGGAGSTSVTVSYTEGANPNNVAGSANTHGLGWKATGTFIKVAGTDETAITGGTRTTTGKKLLKDISSEAITTTQLAGGYFKLYVGIVTNPTAAGEPTGAEVFSGADKTGSYNGTLVVSATVA